MRCPPPTLARVPVTRHPAPPCPARSARRPPYARAPVGRRVALDSYASLDAYEQPTTWTCTWIRLFATGEAPWLPAGAHIVCDCLVDVGTETPRYSVDVSVDDGSGQARHAAAYAWSGDG